ncbi:MAG TPA: hypothetical protein PLM07_20870, partial [Candidatus Rifleibacterium sp.]|nr:hypothetical protein [Candidatus Rifleibacterium sp.]
MKIITSFAKVLILLTLLTGSTLHAQNLDEQTIRISLGHSEIYSTIRLQSFSGNWRLEFRPGKPPLNAVGTLLASAPESIATVSELLSEGEDASIILVPKGMVARLSTEKDLDKGYGSIQVEGGELLSLEIPGNPPMILQGSVSVHHNENSLIVVNQINVRQFIVACVSKICFSNEPEVLKAMIVAIRSKIAYEKDHPMHDSPLYDRYDNDHYLPFDGCGINRELVDILTGMTSNKVLMFKNKLINPRFQNTCGGRISSAKEIYGVDDEPYHASQADIFEGKGSENCFHSPNFHWVIEIQKNELLDFLAVAYA